MSDAPAIHKTSETAGFHKVADGYSVSETSVIRMTGANIGASTSWLGNLFKARLCSATLLGQGCFSIVLGAASVLKLCFQNRFLAVALEAETKLLYLGPGTQF
jgi:hypothetical protein